LVQEAIHGVGDKVIHLGGEFAGLVGGTLRSQNIAFAEAQSWRILNNPWKMLGSTLALMAAKRLLHVVKMSLYVCCRAVVT